VECRFPGTTGSGRTLVVASEPAVGLPIIDAFEQQLGLKFERRRETTDVLVIDSVARPTPD
jgi:uncharacterized protein (TIGR03435 family)